MFTAVGKQTKVFIRFQHRRWRKRRADTERDPRGFALKFYTEDGNWDLVGNNTPVFFIKDPKKFGDFIHTQKRDPRTNCKSPTMMWDFWSPESGKPAPGNDIDERPGHTVSATVTCMALAVTLIL